jgi:hypothetical protein
MLAKLIFNLDKPEDKTAFNCATKGQAIALAVWDILHSEERLSKHCGKKYDSYEVKEIIYEHLESHGINLDELVN